MGIRLNSIVKNVSILSASNILTRLISFAFFIVLARLLTVSEYGLFRYLLSLSLTYAVFYSGFSITISKYLSDKSLTCNKRKILVNNTIFLSIILLMLSLVFAFFVNEDFSLLVLFFFAAFLDFMYIGIIRGVLDYVKLTSYKLIQNILQLSALLILYLKFQEIDIIWAVGLYSVSPLISLILLEVYKRTHLSLRFKDLHLRGMWQSIKFTLPVFLSSVGWIIMFSVNMIVIKHILDTTQVGFYSAGLTIVQIFTFVPAAISTILLPKISGIINWHKNVKNISMAIFGNLLLSFLMLIPLLFTKDVLIELIFGDAYLPTSNIVILLSFAQISISSYTILASFYQGIGKPNVPSYVILSTGLINIYISYILTKSAGLVGAAQAGLISSTLAFIAIFTLYQFEIRNRKNVNDKKS